MRAPFSANSLQRRTPALCLAPPQSSSQPGGEEGGRLPLLHLNPGRVRGAAGSWCPARGRLARLARRLSCHRYKAAADPAASSRPLSPRSRLCCGCSRCRPPESLQYRFCNCATQRASSSQPADRVCELSERSGATTSPPLAKVIVPKTHKTLSNIHAHINMYIHTKKLLCI